MRVCDLEVPRGFEFDCCARRAEQEESELREGQPLVCTGCWLVWRVEEDRLRLVGHITTGKAENYLEEWKRRLADG